MRNEPEGAHNLWVNAWFQDRSRDAAVVRGAALFADQFVPGTAQLTSLGERALDVLVAHYGEHGGTVSVRRGGVSDSLYSARVTAVQNAFLVAAVPEGLVTITDALPGGAGMASTDVAEALAAAPFQPANLSTTSGRGSSSSSGGGQ